MPGLRRRLKVLLLPHKIRASLLEIFTLIFFIMTLTLGVDSVIQAPRLLITSSQGALFLPQMSIQTGAIVLDNTYTGKSVTIMILKHQTNGMSINRYLLWIPPKVIILWDFPIRTDRAIQANRPDIVIRQKQNKTCQLIDIMSVPSDSNISAKEFEKLSKYSKILKLKLLRCGK